METPIPQRVGREFVSQYYRMLVQAPHYLPRFYSHNYRFGRVGVQKPGEEQPSVMEQVEMYKTIMSLNFHDCRAKIRQVDSKATVGNAVVVQVTGELSDNGQQKCQFLQIFVLAPQSPKKYLIDNDIFRYRDVFHDTETNTETPEDAQGNQPKKLSSNFLEFSERPTKEKSLETEFGFLRDPDKIHHSAEEQKGSTFKFAPCCTSNKIQGNATDQSFLLAKTYRVKNHCSQISTENDAEVLACIYNEKNKNVINLVDLDNYRTIFQSQGSRKGKIDYVQRMREMSKEDICINWQVFFSSEIEEYLNTEYVKSLKGQDPKAFTEIKTGKGKNVADMRMLSTAVRLHHIEPNDTKLNLVSGDFGFTAILSEFYGRHVAVVNLHSSYKQEANVALLVEGSDKLIDGQTEFQKFKDILNDFKDIKKLVFELSVQVALNHIDTDSGIITLIFCPKEQEDRSQILLTNQSIPSNLFIFKTSPEYKADGPLFSLAFALFSLDYVMDIKVQFEIRCHSSLSIPYEELERACSGRKVSYEREPAEQQIGQLHDVAYKGSAESAEFPDLPVHHDLNSSGARPKHCPSKGHTSAEKPQVCPNQMQLHGVCKNIKQSGVKNSRLDDESKLPSDLPHQDNLSVGQKQEYLPSTESTEAGRVQNDANSGTVLKPFGRQLLPERHGGARPKTRSMMNSDMNSPKPPSRQNKDRLKTLDLEARSRKNNLIIGGFREHCGEDCKQVIENFLVNWLNIHDSIAILRAYRLGRYTHDKHRRIMVQFHNFADTEMILSEAKNLRKTYFNINRDYPPEIVAARKALWSDYKIIRGENPRSYVRIEYPAKLMLDNRVIRDMFPQ